MEFWIVATAAALVFAAVGVTVRLRADQKIRPTLSEQAGLVGTRLRILGLNIGDHVKYEGGKYKVSACQKLNRGMGDHYRFVLNAGRTWRMIDVDMKDNTIWLLEEIQLHDMPHVPEEVFFDGARYLVNFEEWVELQENGRRIGTVHVRRGVEYVSPGGVATQMLSFEVYNDQPRAFHGTALDLAVIRILP